MVIIDLVKLMRPKQWVKNIFVIAPLFFANAFNDLVSIQNSVLAFVIFCLASSATYVLNDIFDAEADRKHPTKSQKRPIASGRVTVRQATMLLILLYLLHIPAFLVMPDIAFIILGYIFLNAAYLFYLKHQPVLDVFSIAVGFVLRVFAGAEAIGVGTSDWMMFSTFSLALFLASIKRRQELKNSGADARLALKAYTVDLATRFAEISAVSALVFYSLYILTQNKGLWITVPLVMFGLFRFWYIVEVLEDGESPTDVLYSDWPLLLTVLVWGLICTLVISGYGI